MKQDGSAADGSILADEAPPDLVEGENTVARRAFTPPRLEPLGTWSALTLQQSIPIGPGNRY